MVVVFSNFLCIVCSYFFLVLISFLLNRFLFSLNRAFSLKHAVCSYVISPVSCANKKNYKKNCADWSIYRINKQRWKIDLHRRGIEGEIVSEGLLDYKPKLIWKFESRKFLAIHIYIYIQTFRRPASKWKEV
jgi:hypothetical protein